MGVFIAPETPHGKEMWKWDHYVDEVHPLSEPDKPIYGMRPRGFQEFPKMLYVAGRSERTNKIELLKSAKAGNAAEQDQLERQGYVEGPAQAVAKAEALEREIAKLAANRAFQERRMSEAARAEADAYEESVAEHVAEIPEQPKKRGRPRKTIESTD